MSRLAGVLVDALFPPAADALARALDEVGARLLFGGGGGGGGSSNQASRPHLALGLVARQPSGAAPAPRSVAKVQILVRPGPLDPRDFAKLPKLAALAASHASETAGTTDADAEAGAAALKSFVGLISRAAGAATAAAVAAGAGAPAAQPAVHMFAHGFGASPAAWAAALAACPPGIAIKFHALPSGLPPARAAEAGRALARFADEAVAAAEAATLAVLPSDPAALRAALLAGLFRDLAGTATPSPLTLHLPAHAGATTSIACVAQAEVTPLAAPVLRGHARTCPCHGAPVWTAGTTPAYPAAVCPHTGRTLRLDACPPDARSLRVGGTGAPLTLAPTAVAAAAAEELVLRDGGGADDAGPPSLHIVACVPAASLDAGALHGVPTVVMADPLADDEEGEGQRPGRAAHDHPPGGPRGGDPFAGPSDDDDDNGFEDMQAARSPPLPSTGPPQSVRMFAGLCTALRLRGDALVAAARADLLTASAPPTSLLRYYALRPAADADCLLVVGLAGDEERVPLTVAPPRAGGGGGDGAAELAAVVTALDAVRVSAGVGPASLSCGLRDRLPGLAARCVATQAVVPPLPAAGGGGKAGGSGEASGSRQPAAGGGGTKRRKPLAAAAAALCLASTAVRE